MKKNLEKANQKRKQKIPTSKIILKMKRKLTILDW